MQKPLKYRPFGYLYFVAILLLMSSGIFYYKVFTKSQTITKEIDKSAVIENINDSLSDKTTPILEPNTAPMPAVTNPPAIPKFCTKASVLMYHHIQPMERAEKYNQQNLTVTPENFEEHLKYLKEKGYKSIKAEELVKSVIDFKKLQSKTIVITLDDGYSDANEYALKIAKKYDMILNFMLPTGFMDKGGYLTWNSIKDMKKTKLAYFYNHSLTHRAMNYMSYTKNKEEIIAADEDINSHIGNFYKIFSYPMGFYNDASIKALKDAGYKGAFGTSTGNMYCDTNLYAMPRIRIGNTDIKRYGF